MSYAQYSQPAGYQQPSYGNPYQPNAHPAQTHSPAPPAGPNEWTTLHLIIYHDHHWALFTDDLSGPLFIHAHGPPGSLRFDEQHLDPRGGPSPPEAIAVAGMHKSNVASLRTAASTMPLNKTPAWNSQNFAFEVIETAKTSNWAPINDDMMRWIHGRMDHQAAPPPPQQYQQQQQQRPAEPAHSNNYGVIAGGVAAGAAVGGGVGYMAGSHERDSSPADYPPQHPSMNPAAHQPPGYAQAPPQQHLAPAPAAEASHERASSPSGAKSAKSDKLQKGATKLFAFAQKKMEKKKAAKGAAAGGAAGGGHGLFGGGHGHGGQGHGGPEEHEQEHEHEEEEHSGRSSSESSSSRSSSDHGGSDAGSDGGDDGGFDF